MCPTVVRHPLTVDRVIRFVRRYCAGHWSLFNQPLKWTTLLQRRADPSRTPASRRRASGNLAKTRQPIKTSFEAGAVPIAPPAPSWNRGAPRLNAGAATARSACVRGWVKAGSAGAVRRRPSLLSHRASARLDKAHQPMDWQRFPGCAPGWSRVLIRQRGEAHAKLTALFSPASAGGAALHQRPRRRGAATRFRTTLTGTGHPAVVLVAEFSVAVNPASLGAAQRYRRLHNRCSSARTLHERIFPAHRYSGMRVFTESDVQERDRDHVQSRRRHPFAGPNSVEAAS